MENGRRRRKKGFREDPPAPPPGHGALRPAPAGPTVVPRPAKKNGIPFQEAAGPGTWTETSLFFLEKLDDLMFMVGYGPDAVEDGKKNRGRLRLAQALDKAGLMVGGEIHALL